VNNVDGDELDNLHLGNVDLPPNLDTGEGINHKVVVIHGDVDSSVEKSSNPLDRNAIHQTAEAKETSRPVMVDVQETQSALQNKML